MRGYTPWVHPLALFSQLEKPQLSAIKYSEFHQYKQYLDYDKVNIVTARYFSGKEVVWIKFYLDSWFTHWSLLSDRSGRLASRTLHASLRSSSFGCRLGSDLGCSRRLGWGPDEGAAVLSPLSPPECQFPLNPYP